ncbi:MAG TPA: MFS transporter [Acidimicrobiales bacterium]|nr:MFS transporter [Acidimicrobiales bacterium]
MATVGGWRLTFAPYWIGLITAVAVLKVLPPSKRGEGTLSEQLRRAAPYVRNPVVLGATGMTFVLFVLIFGLFLTVLPVHLDEEFGIDAAGRGLILAVPAVTSTITALTLGRLRQRWGVRPLLVAGSICLAVGIGILGVAPSVPILLLGPFVYGFGEGVLIPTLQDIVAGVPPASSRGSVVAFFVGVTRLGQTAGPIATGLALERAGAPGLFLAGAVASMLLAGIQPLALGKFRSRQEVAAPRTN